MQRGKSKLVGRHPNKIATLLLPLKFPSGQLKIQRLKEEIGLGRGSTRRRQHLHLLSDLQCLRTSFPRFPWSTVPPSPGERLFLWIVQTRYPHPQTQENGCHQTREYKDIRFWYNHRCLVCSCTLVKGHNEIRPRPKCSDAYCV